MNIANPGIKVNHHAKSMKSRDCDNISPQLGVGGCTPNPKKLNDDSMSMVEAIPNVADTITGAMALGSICLKIIQ